MCSKGLVQPGAAFTGHSLGEFSALAAVADILPNSSLVDIVFYRGLTMQRAVECDEQGRSNYAMCVVNPSRVGKTFNDAAPREIVNTISNGRDCLLEVCQQFSHRYAVTDMPARANNMCAWGSLLRC
jgi:fatty acid synthase subunit alpha